MKTNDPNLSKTLIEADSKSTATVASNLTSDRSTEGEIGATTSVNNGTETFDDNVVGTEHVKDGDIPARQPDRRDQEGNNAFDEGVNEDTTPHYDKSEPKSDEITDRNRYASIDNAQSRVLNVADQHEDGTLVDSK